MTLAKGMGLLILLALASSLPAQAKPVPAGNALSDQLLADHPRLTIPELLKPWLGWVLHDKESVLCPKDYDASGDDSTCIWAARLGLNLRDKGGTFSQTFRLYRSDWVPLPGSGKLWPHQVQVDGKPAVVVPKEGDADESTEAGGGAGAPRVFLMAGEHVVTGSFFWDELPESIPIPPETGLVTLTISGKPVASPSRQEEGIIYLDKDRDKEAEEKEADALDVTVHRKVVDDIPLRLVTRISLRVAGKRREVTLGKVLPAEFVPLSLDGDLPARLDEAGRLKINLRPGNFGLVLSARKEGSASPLRRPTPEGQWPADEIWVFEAQPVLRGVVIEGVTALDPQQTTLPADWKVLPAFPMRIGDTMVLRQDRRGDQNPVPDHLVLRRRLWLDFDGGAFTASDELQGTLSRTSRLEMAPPFELGRVVLGTKMDQVITHRGGGNARSGIELRTGHLALSADSRIVRNGSALPAVGWDADFSVVHTSLQLPPGWRLFHASGADNVTNTWLRRYTLVALFWALLLSVAIGRLFGIRWGVLALVALGLGCAERDAPRYSLLAVLIVEVVMRLLPNFAQGRLFGLLRLGVRVAAVILILPFGMEQVHLALNPGGEILSEQSPEEIPVWLKQKSALHSDQSGGKRTRDTDGKLGKRDSSPKNKIFGLKGPSPKTGVMLDREAAKPSDLGRSDDDAMAQQIHSEAAEAARAGGLGLVGSGSGGGGTGEGTIGLGNLGTIGRGSGAPGVGGTSAVALKRPAAPPPKPTLRNNAFEIDPNAIAQTGPGLPQWTFHDAELNFTGLVRRDQQIHLYLSPPWLTRGLLLLQAGLLGLLVLRLCGLTWSMLRRGSTATILVLLSLGLTHSARAEYPSDDLLDKLSQRILDEPSCRPICAASERLFLEAQPNSLRLRMEIGAATTTAVPLPGSPAHWLPTLVMVDGKPATALRLSDDHLWLALAAGSHLVVMEGPLPRRDTVQLALPLKPHRVETKLKGWLLEGVHEDGLADDDLQLSQVGKGKTSEDGEAGAQTDSGTGEGTAAQQSNLPPFVLVEREIQIGQKWQVATRVRRQTPTGSAVVLEVPLLAGESVLTPEVRVQNAKALVNMGPMVTEISWHSLLQEKTQLELVAPMSVPWSESWKLTASPIYHTELGGAPVIRQQDDQGLHQPQWRPWPGEKVTIDISRPEGIAGRTLTIDSSELVVDPKLRTTDVQLTIQLRTSRGGPHPIMLPPTALLTSVQIAGKNQPLQTKDGQLMLTLLPGAQEVKIEFQLPQGISTVFVTPEVDLGAPSVNAKVQLQSVAERWHLLTSGPPLGPSVMLWCVLPLAVLLGWLLGRISGTPLREYQFFLLVLGLTHAPDFASFLIVIGWLLALGYRERSVAPLHWLLYNLRQLLLVAWSALALLLLAEVVERGLSGAANRMLTFGNLRTWQDWSWVLDRSNGRLPQVTLVSLPILAFQALMLAWAAWLVLALLRWLRWGYGALATGGLIRRPPPRPPKHQPTAPQSPPPDATPSPAPVEPSP